MMKRGTGRKDRDPRHHRNGSNASGGNGNHGDMGGTSHRNNNSNNNRRSSAAANTGVGRPSRHLKPPPHSQPGTLAGVQSASNQASSSSSGTVGKIFPIRRPDNGGLLAASRIKLYVNNFPITFNPENIIRQYDMDIRPEVPSALGNPTRLSKTTLSRVREKLFTAHHLLFPLHMTVYDGERNIYSAVPLPGGTYKVSISDGEDDTGCSFICSITLVKELKLSKLKDYLAGNVLSMPRDILQGMDLVMKENPARHMIMIGRHFYPFESHDAAADLRGGVAAFRGFQHSLKPTSRGLALSLDYSVLAFRKRIPVIDFLKEHIQDFSINHFTKHRREVEKALKGLKVTMTHRKTKQKYTVMRLTNENTRSLYFDVENSGEKGPRKRINIVNYFWEKYNIVIKYKNIPCLDFSKNHNSNYVPMELCVLVEGQRYPKEHLDSNAAERLKKLSLAIPTERKEFICDMVRAENGPCGEVSQNFGIEVDMNMTKVVGRVILPPYLKLCSPSGKVMKVQVDKKKCQWNLFGKSVVDGKPIERWAILDFSSSERNRLNYKQFIHKLIGRFADLGIRMEEPLVYQQSSMAVFSNVGRLTQIIEMVYDRACSIGRWRPQFLLCVMASKNDGYKNLKWLCETRVGLVTQCCLSNLANRANDQYLANLALKINAKLGGSNFELHDRFPHIECEGHVMFLGADVNHPGARNRTSPSFAAVVGTLNWPAANRYAARVRPQQHRQEMISHFGDMCLELVDTYARINHVRPHKLVLFRDGVSESQFDMVLNEELQDLKRVCFDKDYRPTITIIVTQKRHNTRIFPERDIDGGATGNVPPGTVVDTTVVHPFEFDFYLCSHYGGLGTSKPTHYYVLWDEHQFRSDQLEKLIYNLCFTFARCTKPVSLVTPVYYADLVAYRGRLYHDALMEQSPSSVASSCSSMISSSLSSITSYEDKLYKLHVNLENTMFFV